MANILLTRPLQRAGDLEAVFRAGGHSVFHAPVMQIVPLPLDRMPTAADFEGLLLTSASAVQCLPAPLCHAMAHLPCLATGPATAKALSARGFVDVTHFNGEMDALLEQLKSRVEAGAIHWLYPCGTTLTHTPESLMARSGAVLKALPIYTAEEISAWSAQTASIITETAFDWTVFLSARTAQLFVRNAQQAGIWQASPPGKAACISAAVADAVAPLGFKDSVIGEEKTTSSLVAAMGLTYC